MREFRMCWVALIGLIAAALAPAVAGTGYHVSPAASGSGDGSRSNPWQLHAALQSSSVKPGDTVWIHGGTYSNPNGGVFQFVWECTLNGSSGSPIIVKAFPGERPVLDGLSSRGDDILRISSNYVWYWGLEIMSSATNRLDPTASDNEGSYADGGYVGAGVGINVNQDKSLSGNKFINCVVHDCSGGFASTGIQDNTELYGCMFYNNGWYNSYYSRGYHGHNIYVHNVLGKTKSFYDCIDWGAFENNVQAWGSTDNGSVADNLVFDGFISFLYGSNADGCTLLLGNSNFANPTITNSMFYSRLGHPNVQLGYDNGNGLNTCTGGNISNNYFGGGEFKIPASFSGTTINNNYAWDEAVVGNLPSGSGNTWTSTRPTSNKVVVRQSQYDAGRANVVVYNWTGASSVSVDLSSVYNNGDTYNIVDVQNPTVVVATGKYTGPVSLPMNLTAVAQPVGNSGQSRTHTPPEFGAFIATGGSGTVTVTTPPAVGAGGASNVTTTGAQVTGSVNPNGFSTTYHFDYGTTTGYGTSTASANAGAGTGSSAVSAVLSSLSPATLYHYRLAATNSGGTTNSSDGTFTTGTAAGTPPVVSASAATAITPSGAQLNGTVNPSGLATTYHFDYGTTTSYGTSTASVTAGAGTGSSAVSTVLSGLTPATLYHYRLSASNNGGTANSSDRTMTTAIGPPAPAMPVVATLAPTNVGATVADVAGTINPNGVSTAYHFEYGSTTAYGSLTSTSDAGTGSGAVDVSAVLSNLSPGTLYHYRLVATNAGGTVNGGDMTFTGLSISVHPGLNHDPHTLAQNYPNPFNPSTQIQYDLNIASVVSMKVYNSLGAEVATLVSEFQDAGTHLVQWGGQGFVSGIYFCVLKSGGMTSTRRMILLK